MAKVYLQYKQYKYYSINGRPKRERVWVYYISMVYSQIKMTGSVK